MNNYYLHLACDSDKEWVVVLVVPWALDSMWVIFCQYSLSVRALLNNCLIDYCNGLRITGEWGKHHSI